MNRTDRLLAIVLELQARDRVTAEELARIFEVTKRTIYRDIQALSESGVPVVSAAGQGYWLMEGYFLPPVSLNSDEAIMLILGSELMAQNFDAQYRAAADSASRKIQAVLSELVQEEVAYLKDNIRFISAESQTLTDVPALLKVLRRAILERKTVELQYIKRAQGLKSETSERKVDPHGLVQFNGTWMLSAYCHLRKAIRIFRLDRIEGVKVLPDSFERQLEYNVRKHRATDNRAVKVELLFAKEIARWVRECPAFFATEFEELPEGLKASFKVQHLDDALPWMMSWGSKVSILSPEPLKARLKEELEAMLKQCEA